MKKIVLFIAALFSTGALFAQDCSDIIISEYVEGWYNNKAVELYNPTSAPITLDNVYRLIRWSNGSTTSDQDPLYVCPLLGTIAPYHTWVIIQDTIPDGQDTMVWAGLRAKADWLAPYDYGGTTPGGNCVFWNGDDAVSLSKKQPNGTWKDIDIFGEIGVRPLDWQGGTTGAWTDTKPYWRGQGAYLTKDQTLIRRHGVLQGIDRIDMSHYGDSVTGGYPNSFNAFAEYDSMPANYFDSLGTHWCNCRPPYVALDLGPDQTVSATDAVTLDAGNFATYLWSTGATTRTVTIDSAGVGLGTKKVYCRVEDSYGFQSDTVRITFSPNQILNLGPDQSVFVGDIVTLDAGPFTTYEWSTGAVTQVVTIDSAGVGFGTKKVYCKVTDIHGTQSDTVRITFKAHLGVNDPVNSLYVTIQPNPVNNNRFTVTCNQTINSIEVISIVGKTIYASAAGLHQKEVKVTLSEIPEGVYLVRISYGNNQSVIKKIVIQ